MLPVEGAGGCAMRSRSSSGYPSHMAQAVPAGPSGMPPCVAEVWIVSWPRDKVASRQGAALFTVTHPRSPTRIQGVGLLLRPARGRRSGLGWDHLLHRLPTLHMPADGPRPRPGLQARERTLDSQAGAQIPKEAHSGSEPHWSAPVGPPSSQPLQGGRGGGAQPTWQAAPTLPSVSISALPRCLV